MTARGLRVSAVALLLAAPLAWWWGLVLFDPEVELLVGREAPWVVDPRWQTRPRTPEPFPPTRYILSRQGSGRVPGSLPVEIRAMRELRVLVDGELRFDFAGWHRAHWKEFVRLDLGPWLREAREELVVEVANDQGPPALQVVALDEAAAPWVETGRAPWRTSTLGLPPVPAAIAGEGEAELQLPRWRWRHPRLYGALLAGIASLVLVGFLRRRPRPREGAGGRAAVDTGPDGSPAGADPTGEPGPGEPARRRWHPAVVAVLLLVAGVNLWNASQFPYSRSRMDWGGHRDHLRYAAEHWRPSLAEEGWQMYQPPLYYWVGGTVLRLFEDDVGLRTSLRWIQVLGAGTAVLHVFLAALVLRRFGPASGRAQALALLAVGLAPGAVTTNAMLTNEPFAAFMCGVPLAAGAWVLAGRRYGPGWGALLGLLGGLALNSKFTGLMPVAALGATLGVAFLDEPGRRRAVAATLGAFVVVAALVGGPYYARNLAVYGKPFVGNWDRESGRYYEQEPGYRTPAFYTTFGDVFVYPPERARFSSFWDGLYASWWSEIHNNFVPPREPRTIRLSLLLFALALVPTAALVAGGVRSVRRAFRDGPASRVHLLFVLVALFSFASVAVFMLRLPFHSTMKAFFLMNLMIPAALFTAQGMARLERGLGRGRVLLDAAAVAFTVLVLQLFLWR